MSLDRSSPLPLYHQLSELLLGQIVGGQIKPHEAMLTERELIDMFGVSRITVRRALEELEHRGYIQREQGRGTFVAPARIQRGVAKLTSFSEEIAARGMTPGVRLLALHREPAAGRVAHELQIQPGMPIWLVERLRFADSECIVLNISYLSLPAQVTLTEEELTREPSLWALLERKGIRMATADKTIEAIVADEEQARLLQVPRAAPLLLVEGVVYTGDGTPVEFHQIIGRADRYKYYLHVTR
jgi:GntR family transcriptional regulator